MFPLPFDIGVTVFFGLMAVVIEVEARKRTPYLRSRDRVLVFIATVCAFIPWAIRLLLWSMEA